jgi:hypothetical protein
MLNEKNGVSYAEYLGHTDPYKLREVADHVQPRAEWYGQLIVAGPRT